MLRDIFSRAYSVLYIVGDNADWVIDEEAKALKKIAESIGLKARVVKRVRLNLPQFVHYTSQFSILGKSIFKSKHKISVDYFHGKPDQQESFRKCFEVIKNNHQKIFRVRVSTKEMESLMLSTGIDKEKVVRIAIGINTDLFKPQTEVGKLNERKRLDIPEQAFVVGSFQKDGVGWSDGNEPKLIKGPDVFLKVVEKLKMDTPNLFVLLSGPARGFVKMGLDKIGVPYKHTYLKDYRDISGLYNALDLYIISSREEGGPKACLESMAKGIPLVTTAVGQCKDLVISGQNGLMAPIDNIEELHSLSLNIKNNSQVRETVITGGLKTARENNYDSQTTSWKEFFS